MNIKLSIILFLIMCSCVEAKDYIDTMMKIPDETQRIVYVCSLTTNEVWLMASQAFDKGWDSVGAGAILAAHFGENWERNTPSMNTIKTILQNRKFNSKLRGALAASGFEISRLWTMEDRLKYFDLIVPLFNEDDIPDIEKIRMAEYSFLAFKRCLSEVQVLSEKNVTKTRLLNACHTCAREMIKTLATVVEKCPKEKASDVVVKTLENYAKEYKRGDFPSSPELQKTVEEAAKTDSLLRRYRKN
ncbi:MAG: hypothetical protein RBR35_14045 [Salinivirgaceae bacterium]|nr:hypothetical protein [Salinivirgaceae bacterium]